MSALISIQLTAIEAAMLFQFMEIPEGQTLLEELGVPEAENLSVDQYATKVLKQLEDAGLLQLNGKQIILESRILDHLKACKYSSALSRMKVLNQEGESAVTYAFISGAQVVEMSWSSGTGDVILTSLKDGVEEMISRIGDQMLLPDTENNSYSIQLQPKTFKEIQAQLGQADRDVYETILSEDDTAEEHAVGSLIETCRSLEQWGVFDTIIRGTDIRSQTVHFLGSPSGNWIFIQDGDGMVHGFQLTEPELIQSLYLITTRSLSIFAPD